MTIILKAILIVGTMTHSAACEDRAVSYGALALTAGRDVIAAYDDGMAECEAEEAALEMPACEASAWAAYDVAKAAGRDAEQAYYDVQDSCSEGASRVEYWGSLGEIGERVRALGGEWSL